MALTAAQAIERLKDITTIDQLNDLIRQIDIHAPGSTTLLYSGQIEGGLNNGDIARELAARDPNIRIIDNTEVAKFLNVDRDSLQRNEALAKKLKQLLGGEAHIRGTPANQWLFGQYDASDTRVGNGKANEMLASAPLPIKKYIYGFLLNPKYNH